MLTKPTSRHHLLTVLSIPVPIHITLPPPACESFQRLYTILRCRNPPILNLRYQYDNDKEVHRNNRAQCYLPSVNSHVKNE